MAGTIGRQMAVSYAVEVTGIQRTQAQLNRLSNVIKSLRNTNYSPSTSTTIASSLGGKDLAVFQFDNMEGRILGSVEKIMDEGVKRGKEYQTYVLASAVTPTGLSGKGRNPGGRRGPGRDDTGSMIDAIATNVEVLRGGNYTRITGWHGWGTEVRSSDNLPYIKFQEKGTEKIKAANSLGSAIPPVREFLKAELGKLTL